MIIKVSGLHTEHVPAERCVVSLTVAHESTSQGEAYDAVSKATNEISAYLKKVCKVTHSFDIILIYL